MKTNESMRYLTNPLDSLSMDDNITIVAVGSVDGISAASIMKKRFPDAHLVFTQAFQVDRLDPTSWLEKSKVILLDLAVNNGNPNMTKDFCDRILNAGHNIVAIADEHDADAWKKIINFDNLLIRPVSQNIEESKKSTCAILMDVLTLDEHERKLANAGDAGDRMEFEGIGKYINDAVKSNIFDNSRREYMANYFSTHSEPNETILGWIKEYDIILKNHEEIIKNKTELTKDIVMIDASDKNIDATTLFKQLYKDYSIVVLKGSMFNPKIQDKEIQISVATKDSSLNLMELVDSANIEKNGGFAQKVNLPLSSEKKIVGLLKELKLSF